MLSNQVKRQTPQEISKKRTRDIVDFIDVRTAIDSDDEKIGSLLVSTFTETYALKIPHIVTTEERLAELRNVKQRRECGITVVLELGYRIIGTFTLIRPDTIESQNWIKGAATLRCVAVDPEFHGLGFSEILLNESERIAMSWSINFICLHVQKGADGVAHLYKKRGYIREPYADLLCHGSDVQGYFLPLDNFSMIRAPQ